MGISDSGTCLTQTSILMEFTIAMLGERVNIKNERSFFFLDFTSSKLYE